QLQPALDHLHKKGFVHGDFRGQNILIEEGSKKI
uniref:Protein kinase domain-containing protein n=1 Tax=Strigamia maritima TaxID=126957 RepID=T1JJE8_STRMM